MPLDERLVPIALANLDVGGTDPRLVSGLLRLENGRFERAGAITKRKGLAAPVGASDDGILAVRKGTPVQVGDRVYTGDTSIGISAEILNHTSDVYAGGRIDAESEILYAPTGAGHSSISQYSIFGQEQLQKGLWRAVCWTREVENTSPVEYVLECAVFHATLGYQNGPTFTNSDTYTVPVCGKLVDTGQGGIWWVYVAESGGSTYVAVRQISAGGFLSETILTALTVVSDNNSKEIDAIGLQDAQGSICIAHPASAGTAVALSVYETSGGASRTLASATGAIHANHCFGLAAWEANDDEFALIWYDATSQIMRWGVWDIDLLAVKAAATFHTLAANDLVVRIGGVWDTTNGGAYSGAGLWIVYTSRDTSTTPHALAALHAARVDGSGVHLANSDIAKGVTLWTRPWMNTDNHLQWGAYVEDRYDAASLQARTGATFLIGRMKETFTVQAEGPTHRAIAKIHPDAAGAHPYFSSASGTPNRAIVSVQAISSGLHRLAALRVVDSGKALSGNHRVNAITLVTLTEDATAVRPVDLGDVVLIPGSMPYVFDGRTFVEQGFLMTPHANTGSDVAANGSGGAWSGASGLWGYQAVYEHRDGVGRKHLSTIGGPWTLTVNATVHDNVTITVPTLKSARRVGTEVGLYRTSAANGTAYRRLQSKDNDVTVDDLTFTDTGTDNKSNPQLYTDSGELFNEQAPPYHAACVWQNRLFYAPDDHPDEFRYSKVLSPPGGLAGVAFSGFLRQAIPGGYGKIVQLEALDDKLLIFCERAVLATSGTPLDNWGQGQGLVFPWLVSNAVGCTNRMSVVRMPLGVMFESETGLQLIDSGGKVSDIGRPVKYFTDNNTISGAHVQRTLNQVIFTTQEGVALVFNYLFGQWSHYAGYAATSSIVDGNGNLWIKPNGAAAQHEGSTYVDVSAGTDVALKVDTGHIHLAGLLGYARCRRFYLLLSNLGDHTLTVKTAYDLEPTWTDTQTFTAASAMLPTFNYADFYGPGLASSYQDKAYMLRVDCSRQRCTSIRIQVTDEGSGNSNEAIELLAIVLHTAVKKGLRPLGDARSIT